MTFVAAWMHKNSVYLIADSAVTSRELDDSGAARLSSFGQADRETSEGHVSEKLLKIIRVAPGVAIAYSGFVHTATHVIGFIKERLLNEASVTEAMQQTFTSLGPFPEDKGCVLLVAEAGNEGEPSHLYLWTTTGEQQELTGEYTQIGSLPPERGAYLAWIVNGMRTGDMDETQFLPIAIAFAQSNAIYEDVVAHQVSGLTFGLRCAAGEVQWQRDTHYLFYHDPTQAPLGFISAIERDNALAVSSSYTDDIRVFASPEATGDMGTWMARWADKLSDELGSPDFPFWVFYSVKNRVITLCERKDPPLKPHLVSMTSGPGGRFDIYLHQELVDTLATPLSRKPAPDEVAYRFNYRTM
jgi:hypothetical protein